jgi:hypothetical protein
MIVNSTGSVSPGRHVFLIQCSSGSYIRRIANQHFCQPNTLNNVSTLNGVFGKQADCQRL